MDLIQTWTEDGLGLPGFHLESEEKDLCVLFVHGMASSFLSSPLGNNLGYPLQKEGIGFVYSHNRGFSYINDILTRDVDELGATKTKIIGAAYEDFSDCVLDIDAWVDKVLELGYKRIIILGHSLGATKCVYYLGKKKREEVVGFVMASSADVIGLVTKAGYQPDYEELLREAKDLVSSGRGDQLLSGKIWGAYIVSAKTFLKQFVEGCAADVLPIQKKSEHFDVLEKIELPILCLSGGNDDTIIWSLEEDQKIIESRALAAKSFDRFIVPGADHLYTRKSQEVFKTIMNWVNKI